MSLTFFVSDVRAGSILEQLQGTLPLASIGGTVQWSVTQQICAVDVQGLLPAELQKTHRTDVLSSPETVMQQSVTNHSGYVFYSYTVVFFIFFLSTQLLLLLMLAGCVCLWIC